MEIEHLRDVLLGCTVVNYGVLLTWFLVFVLAHEWLHQLHGRWFHVSHERLDAVHYAGMSAHKIGILLFNLVPFLVLTVLR
jgi:hypothetical protein